MTFPPATGKPIPLSWGAPDVVPGNATAAWGARMIVDQWGMVDILPDRQDAGGPDYKDLLARLNGGVLKEVKETISDLLRYNEFFEVDDLGFRFSFADGLLTNKAEPFIVHMDDRVTVYANTNGSYGYCYVTAWLTPATSTCRHCGRPIVKDAEEGWIDPEAGYDDEDGDGIWRVTCDRHDTFIAEHEPEEDADPTPTHQWEVTEPTGPEPDTRSKHDPTL
jgi:hypothetical protein